MIRVILYFILFFNFSIILGQTEEVSVDMKMPKEIIAGHRFTINVFIHKEDLKSFARLQLDLPTGFKATEKISANADFKVELEKITFFWIELPVEQDFMVSVQIDVAPNMQGYYVVSGKFSFVEENVNKSLEIYPNVITVKPKGSENEGFNILTPKTDSTTNEYDAIGCIRQEPYLSSENVVIVNLLVNKGNLNKFGKVEEQIPPGFTPESITSKNAIFVFNNNSRTVKFMWMNLPEESQFVVSYKLIPDQQIPERVLTITGTFSYAENKESKTVDTIEKDIDLK